MMSNNEDRWKKAEAEGDKEMIAFWSIVSLMGIIAMLLGFFFM